MPPSQYPYLWSSIAVTVLAVILLAALARERLPMLVGGAVNAALAWCGFALQDEYWTPVRLGAGSTGVEDVLMAFACGVLAWAIASLFRPLPRQAYLWHPQRLAIRLAGSITSALVVFFGLWFAGVSAMSVYIGGMAFATAALLIWRPGLWRLAVWGGAGFLAFWACFAWTTLQVWPDAISAWNTSSPWGRAIAGIPRGELAWALAFGTAWPLYTAFVLDVRARSGDAGTPR